MREIPVHNDTEHNMHVAGSVIRPGETKIFPAHDVPEKFREAAGVAPVDEKPPVENPIEDLAKGKVVEIVAALPALSDDALDQLEAIEGEGQKRKGVIEGIAADRLRRAAAAAADVESNAAAAAAAAGDTEGQ